MAVCKFFIWEQSEIDVSWHLVESFDHKTEFVFGVPLSQNECDFAPKALLEHI